MVWPALLAGGMLSESEAMEAFPELHERYAEAFGVDPETGRRTTDAMQEARNESRS